MSLYLRYLSIFTNFEINAQPILRNARRTEPSYAGRGTREDVDLGWFNADQGRSLRLEAATRRGASEDAPSTELQTESAGRSGTSGARGQWEKKEKGYLRIPRLGLFSCCCRFLPFLRLGLLMMNVPEPI